MFKDKTVTFIIHSGFSEAIHLKNLEQYIYRFTDLMEMDNYGVFNLPGSEGFRVMPEQMIRKKAEYVAAIGDSFRLKQDYNKEIKSTLEGPAVLSGSRLLVFKLLKISGIHIMYWNNQLKKNGVYKERFAAPYERKD